jgi:hypothetical protein
VLRGSQPSGNASTLKRRRGGRGSDVRRSCSCFRLFADSDRWRFDRRGRVRLRLDTNARSSSSPHGRSGDGTPGSPPRRQRRRVDREFVRARLSVEGPSGRNDRSLSRGGGNGDLGRVCRVHSLARHARRRSARGEPHGPTESRIRSTSFPRQTEARCNGVNRATHRCPTRLTLRRPSISNGCASTRL